MSAKVKSLVNLLLKKYKIIKPPIPIESIAKKENVRIKYSEFDDSISGLLYRKNEQDVIGVNKNHPTNRRRFTIAHELGHLILNHQGMLFVDKEPKLYRDIKSQDGSLRQERQANKFAAEILMHEEMLIVELKNYEARDFDDTEYLNRITNKFKVSVQALTIRMANLGLISL